MSGVFDGHLPLTRNASAAAVELIRAAILQGRLPPGHRLKEGELARELGISRTPIREALFVLQAEGLVVATPNRGATVRSYELDELRDMYDLRAVLEGHAARRAASRLEQAQIDELRASCDRFAAVAERGELSAIVAENLFFHEAIHEAAASARLTEMVQQTIALPLVYRSFVWYSLDQIRTSLHHHRQLVGAFEQRDAERAEMIMKEHVHEALDVLVAHVTEAGGMTAVTARRVECGVTEAAGPLEGVRVIELGQLLAGPFTGRLLGDLGAEIIKVEAPGQPDPIREWGKARYEGRSLWWPVQSRNKKCITLNLRHERGQELLLGLVEHADVVVENFRPGTLEKWSLGYERLSEINPKIVLARVSGYGQTGPYAKRAGFASVSEAMGGIRHINGFPGQPPPRMHLSLGDSLAGMFAVQGILAALYWRDALGGGLGQVVDVSLMEASFALLESTVPEYDRLGIVRGPQGTNLKGIAPSNIFESSDGKWIVIAANADNVFRRLCEAMGRSELADDPEVLDPHRAGRQPGRDRGHRRLVGGRANRKGDRRDAERGGRHLRADLHDRRHLRGPSVPGQGDAPAARRPGVR